MRLAELEDTLSDVKALFKAKFGENVGDDSEGESEHVVQKDGITWMVSALLVLQTLVGGCTSWCWHLLVPHFYRYVDWSITVPPLMIKFNLILKAAWGQSLPRASGDSASARR